MDVLHVPPNHLKIREIWAFISVDDKGNEGVCAYQADGIIRPMITADKELLDTLEPIAKQLAKISPHPIKLIRLVQREEVRIIKP